MLTLCLLLCILGLTIRAFANSTTVISVSDVFSQLQNLTLEPPLTPPSTTWRPTYLGGQNFTHCCLLAVNHSLIFRNGQLDFNPSSSFIIGNNISEFRTAAEQNFPCGATYNGDRNGAPVIQAPYQWCRSNCDGWQISHRDNLAQWIGPLVGFILPCLAFCLNISKSWNIKIPSVIWNLKPERTTHLITYFIQLPPALFLVTLDTIIWLSCCFAFAGPMLLSAVYEAAFDNKLLNALHDVVVRYRQTSPSLSQELRAKMLFVALVGNIKFQQPTPSLGQQMLTVLAKLRLVPYHISQEPLARPVEEVEQLTQNMGLGYPIDNTAKVKVMLKSVLASQPSFGSAVGAPVIFFIGAFIYNLIDIRSRLGDNDTAHALAFGMWWMIVPLLAIVSNILLASNNPSTIQGIVDRVPPHEHNKWSLFTPSSEGRYQTVDIWDRGTSKRRWFAETIKAYRRNQPRGTDDGPPLRDIEMTMEFTRSDERWVVTWAFLILLAPCLLAFLTSYHTPRIGLACRSLTHLGYFSAQLSQMLVWLAQINMSAGTPNPAPNPALHILSFILGSIAVFTSIGGTLMQLIGVYRNCICKMSTRYWLSYMQNDIEAWVPLSTDTAEMIQAASTWWQGTAITAICVLCLVCAFGWWHQQRLKKRFGFLVDKIDQNVTWHKGDSSTSSASALRVGM